MIYSLIILLFPLFIDFFFTEDSLGTSPVKKPIAASLPEAPTQPVISDVTDTTVHLSWAPGNQNTQFPVEKFYVEYFGYETTDVRVNI